MDETKGITRDQRSMLTLEAEQAIRQYLWRYIGPSSIILALLSGLLGFFIRDIAIERATHGAFAAVQKTIMEMAQKTIEAKTRADMAVKDVEDLQKSAKSQAEIVDKQMRILDERAKQLASTMADLENQAREQARILSSSPEHLNRIANFIADDPRLTKIVRDYITAKENSFQKIDAVLEKMQTAKTLQVECKKGTIRSGNKQTKFTFKFPVQQIWIEYIGSVQSPLDLEERIEGNAVTLIRRPGDGGIPAWPEDDVACKVCAAGS